MGKTYDNLEFNQNILFSKIAKKGESVLLTTNEKHFLLNDSNLEDLDVRKIDSISLGNQKCNNLFISDLNCQIVDNLEDHLVAYYSLDQEDLIYNELEGSEWSNASASARLSGTTYYERNGDVIIVNRAEGNWPGAGILYTTNKKTKYNIKAEFNVLNGQGFVGYHLYKDGSVVNYNVPTDTQGMFPGYHPSTYFNYNAHNIGSYKIDTIIDLSSAPDFDSIHFAILDYNNPNFTNIPAVIFNINSVAISEILVEDLSGYENHGQIIGTTFTEDQKGKANGAMLFNGTSDYIYIGDVIHNYEEFTILLWSKAESTTQTHVKNLIGKGSWNYWDHWYLGYKSGTNLSFVYAIQEPSPWNFGPSYPIISFAITNWNFFTGVANLIEQKLFLNSNLVSTSQKIHGAANGGSHNLEIARSSYLANYYNGAISTVKIYNKELTEKEIRAIYNETRTN